MENTLFNKLFWNKTLLSSGKHNVIISHVEKGASNNNKNTPFVILFFENADGWFPHKINFDLNSPQNIKYLEHFYSACDLKKFNNYFEDSTLLLNKELEINIDGSASIHFGKGVKVTSFNAIQNEEKIEGVDAKKQRLKEMLNKKVKVADMPKYKKILARLTQNKNRTS